MKQFLSLLLAPLMILTPLTVLAQNDPELETYTSEDGLLTADYPAQWGMFIPEDNPFPTVVFVNGEDGVERFAADEDIQPGDQAMFVLLMPGEFLRQMEIITADFATTADFARALAEAIMAPNENDSEEYAAALAFGEAEAITLVDDIAAGYVPVTDHDSDGAFIIYELNDDLYAIFKMDAYLGEYDDALRELGERVAATIHYDGTADDIIAAFMAGSADDTLDEGTAADLDGAALVAERCTVCHTAERIEDADKTEAGWTATVDRMIGYGAELDDAEREAVIAYLSGM